MWFCDFELQSFVHLVWDSSSDPNLQSKFDPSHFVAVSILWSEAPSQGERMVYKWVPAVLGPWHPCKMWIFPCISCCTSWHRVQCSDQHYFFSWANSLWGWKTDCLHLFSWRRPALKEGKVTTVWMCVSKAPGLRSHRVREQGRILQIQPLSESVCFLVVLGTALCSSCSRANICWTICESLDTCTDLLRTVKSSSRPKCSGFSSFPSFLWLLLQPS